VVNKIDSVPKWAVVPEPENVLAVHFTVVPPKVSRVETPPLPENVLVAALNNNSVAEALEAASALNANTATKHNPMIFTVFMIFVALP